MCLLGNGGDAGRMNFRVREINGKVDVRTCRGNGAFPASTGLGGSGKKIISVLYFLPNSKYENF